MKKKKKNGKRNLAGNPFVINFAHERHKLAHMQTLPPPLILLPFLLPLPTHHGAE